VGSGSTSRTGAQFALNGPETWSSGEFTNESSSECLCASGLKRMTGGPLLRAGLSANVSIEHDNGDADWARPMRARRWSQLEMPYNLEEP